jgi:hypothetical protein
MDQHRGRWALAGTLGLWGGVGVVLGSGINVATSGQTPWAIAVVPLGLDTVLGLFLGLQQRRRLHV